MRLTIAGRNPRAHGSECVIFGHFAARGGGFVPVAAEPQRELEPRGGWERRPMRPGVAGETAPAWVGWTEGADHCLTSGRLLTLSHRWSGMLQVNNVGRKYEVDLYSDATRLTLLDLVDEVMVDVGALAAAGRGGLSLPALTRDLLVRHVAETGAWFRLLEPDPGFRPGLLRRVLETFRRKPDSRVKLRLVAALLPAVVARPAVPPPPSFDESSLRDEVRLLAAAVEGVALRAPA